MALKKGFNRGPFILKTYQTLLLARRTRDHTFSQEALESLVSTAVGETYPVSVVTKDGTALANYTEAVVTEAWITENGIEAKLILR